MVSVPCFHEPRSVFKHTESVVCGGSGAALRVGFARAEIDPFNVEIVTDNTDRYELFQYVSLLRLILKMELERNNQEKSLNDSLLKKKFKF